MIFPWISAYDLGFEALEVFCTWQQTSLGFNAIGLMVILVCYAWRHIILSAESVVIDI
ncbi:MAG: hypothetical protein WC136_01670 [Sphaerochaeta sp.]